MNPFVYPKVRHQRTLTPFQYASHSGYKPSLKIEFKNKCVYCQMVDSFSYSNFGVDHYRPQVLFPELATTYSNLFYCCNPCNSRKGAHWPTIPQEPKQMIPNPCDHVMFEHLSFERDTGRVIAKSDRGEFTKALLDLNSPESLQVRNVIKTTIDTTQSQKIIILKKIEKLSSKRNQGQFTDAEIDEGLNEFNDELLRLDQLLSFLYCS